MSLDQVRAVADAVLYEGYLLYPYRATSSKNQARWQWGVLGPSGAMAAGLGEDCRLSMQTLLDRPAPVTVHVRFLQVQQRRAQVAYEGGFVDVPELRAGDRSWYSWDEATEVERAYAATADELLAGRTWTVAAEAGAETEDVPGAGRLLRERTAVRAEVTARLEPVAGLHRLTVAVTNTASTGPADEKDSVLRRSLVGTHLIIEAGGFVSVIDPPPYAAGAARQCAQHRCWPVLAGDAGASDVVLGSPIILYDHPEIAGESTGSLFDGTEIDEILTLRVMTMTEAEKAEARATDPRAAEIIDRCDAMTTEELQRLHGTMRESVEAADPFAGAFDGLDDDPFAVFNDHDPESASVVVAGVPVAKGSTVRLSPQRRADAQDLFYGDQLARVTAVHRDLDGETHVAVVLLDDPAADLHDWYGRYLYFSPDEVIPVETPTQKEGER